MVVSHPSSGLQLYHGKDVGENHNEMKHAPQCSLQHYLQKLGSNIDANRQMNG